MANKVECRGDFSISLAHTLRTMSVQDETYLQIDSPDGEFSVIVESDERVAYAYLLRNGNIIGDVWLCNTVPPPDKVDWQDPSQMPFQNPIENCSDRPMPSLAGSVECRWWGEMVEIVASGERIARLCPGASPGWSLMAAKDSPFAKILE